MRSRFHVATLIFGCAMLLSACSSHFGAGIAELPASQGWTPLPIGSWVLNDGLEARSMVFCPRDTCSRQGFASVVAFTGSEAKRMEEALKADPASLARLFSKPPPDESRSRKKARPKGPAKSTTTVTRFEAEGVAGILVEIRARDASGKSAATAILHGREADALVVALAVAEDPAAARRDAVAAWRSR
ncbi:hypothetical protein [Bosea vaviloviae]|uniref:Uncharacterized protein n=1 Tax=Bosea vaviloviae TaxID=1526658 RepID=A0A0N1MZW3_9HYPH|nr:hypothetical protein [Bosea vaviloviae]KPH75029.1 hypothetical protein AE618_24970 [Bosea vaviloviae]